MSGISPTGLDFCASWQTTTLNAIAHRPMLRASYTQPGFCVRVQLGGLIKKIAMYLLAVAIPLGLILVYEGFISSKNREFFQEQERKSNQQQALEQPAQVQREKQRAQENIE